MMKKRMLLILLVSAPAFAGLELRQGAGSIAAWLDGKALWTYNCDPADGKPWFHPLASTEGTVFTDLRPEDHPWHRGVWFSWKFINGVNYWEEERETHASAGETRIRKVAGTIKDQTARINLEIEYAPAGTEAPVMRENRLVVVAAPDETGTYSIDWSSTFQALEKTVVLDRTPIPGQPGGKSWGGYAGWSVRMNAAMKGGTFLDSEGRESAHRAAAAWTLFNAPEGGSLLFMDHPDNFGHPSKWYIAPGMPFFGPAVIHDAPQALQAGETRTLNYRLVVLPGIGTREAASRLWKKWTRKNVVILTGANNHDWQATTPALKAILEESGNFNVDVVTHPEQLSPEVLAGYDVLLSNWNAFGKNQPAPWSGELKKAYVDFVRKGGGHVAVHAGSSSFYDWDDYHAICLATWKGGTGHRKPHGFDVRFLESGHPVSLGLENFETSDELWFKPFVHPDATVIAESFSQHTGNWEPTALTGQFGEGRCFTLLLGHSAAAMENRGFRKLLVAGVRWAADDATD
ncbi:hypothetical protein PDESU_00028 [Pontiella desulfatans]|uniref:ThuA-like domain-containing protein n=1 Tax=Pontiella desulfatans TaxID=2750659 RepID=A0A6C2TVH5_PONDE|nr:DUF6807 family protein [Pontiella desulfatans]VGO11484.1 hypothetical protein PDESU_00028 [Pontiella desulfatans]